MNLLAYLQARLREPSTWSGFIKLATAIAIYVQPDKVDNILAIGVAVNGLFNVASKERQS